MMAYSDDHIALAAEYALGTLDADERAQAEALMSVDEDFAGVVLAWEQRLGALNQMVGAIEPSTEVWGRIKAEIGQSEPQAAHVLPGELRAPLIAASETPARVTDSSNVLRLTANLRRWRAIASATSAIAAVLVAAIGLGLSMPDLLPDNLRPKPLPQMAEARRAQAVPEGAEARRAPAAPAAKASGQYVAVLQKEGGSPAFILTVDVASKNFTVRKVGASAEPGTSFELWLISDRLPKPRSLGVIGADDFTLLPALASYDAGMAQSATYAVTVEQAGGSPDGSPHSAPIFTGKLIEAVPPTR
jgi:anti-sigma-K factor RskA